ncbi:hypothetical protein [Streptococcus sp. CSL10205-OR2]|uniref:hypothetical protein n=1 Tax=Streptococcus sp. CSL10205-OR2 TaxID=2980558 RepID=UPI0021D9F660|nr:hypothetical protein [Streptococcus sp. CSL10205-OR2]MCU9533691.1 hypothetical protein [Streptococcus sp. CSL10205-OR2]
MKKILRICLGLLFAVAILGGCSMTSHEETLTLTKEQQDNVVKMIARNYNIESIEFENFNQNESTGNYLLKLKINNDEDLGTVISADKINIFDHQNGLLALDPIDNFQPLLKEVPLPENSDVDIQEIKIIYLGE